MLKGNLIFKCDKCGRKFISEIADYEEFEEVAAEIEGNGWTFDEGDINKQYCLSCSDTRS